MATKWNIKALHYCFFFVSGNNHWPMDFSPTSRRASNPESTSKLERIKQTIPHYIGCMSIQIQPRHMSVMTFHSIGILILCILYRGIMSAMVSRITSVSIVYSTVCSGADKKTSKIRVTGLCVGNSPVTGELPTHRANNTESVSICWRHHGI